MCSAWSWFAFLGFVAVVPLQGALALSVTNTNNATTLGRNIIGDGITFINATFTGVAAAAGIYTQGPQTIGNGFILSTGQATDAQLAQSYLANTNNAAGSNSLCSQIVSGATYLDAAVLSMYINLDTSKYNGLSVNMIFSSEEYPNFVGGQYFTFKPII